MSNATDGTHRPRPGPHPEPSSPPTRLRRLRRFWIKTTAASVTALAALVSSAVFGIPVVVGRQLVPIAHLEDIVRSNFGDSQDISVKVDSVFVSDAPKKVTVHGSPAARFLADPANIKRLEARDPAAEKQDHSVVAGPLRIALEITSNRTEEIAIDDIRPVISSRKPVPNGAAWFSESQGAADTEATIAYRLNVRTSSVGYALDPVSGKTSSTPYFADHDIQLGGGDTRKFFLRIAPQYFQDYFHLEIRYTIDGKVKKHEVFGRKSRPFLVTPSLCGSETSAYLRTKVYDSLVTDSIYGPNESSGGLDPEPSWPAGCREDFDVRDMIDVRTNLDQKCIASSYPTFGKLLLSDANGDGEPDAAILSSCVAGGDTSPTYWLNVALSERGKARVLSLRIVGYKAPIEIDSFSGNHVELVLGENRTTVRLLVSYAGFHVTR